MSEGEVGAPVSVAEVIKAEAPATETSTTEQVADDDQAAAQVSEVETPDPDLVDAANTAAAQLEEPPADTEETPPAPPTVDVGMAPEVRKKKEVDRPLLDTELKQVGDTLENSGAAGFIDLLQGVKTEEQQRELIAKNKGLQGLRARYKVKNLDIKDGKEISLSDAKPGEKPRYSLEDGRGIRAIGGIDPATGELLCIVDGADKPVPVDRAVLLDIMLQVDLDEIIESFPEEDQVTMKRYYEALNPKNKNDEHYEGLTELTAETAERNNLRTTDRILRAMKWHYRPELAREGASEDEIKAITAKNAEKEARLKVLQVELPAQFGDRILATPGEIQAALTEMGVDSKGVQKAIADARASIPIKRELLKDPRLTSAQKDKLKEELDLAEATIEVYKVALENLNEDTVKDFFDKQDAGLIPADVAARVFESFERGEMEAIILMASPDASLSATAEQKAKMRLQKERLDKYLKGIGIVGGIAALLLVLGISQGAK